MKELPVVSDKIREQDIKSEYRQMDEFNAAINAVAKSNSKLESEVQSLTESLRV